MGPQRRRPALGSTIFWLVCCFCFFPFCFFCATACGDASLMQEPSGPLAPFFRVFLPLFHRRSEASGAAAPHRPVAQTCAGGATKTPWATAQPAPHPTTDQGDSPEGCRNSLPVGSWSATTEGGGAPATPRNGRRSPAGGAVRGHAALARPTKELPWDCAGTEARVSRRVICFTRIPPVRLDAPKVWYPNIL